MMGAIPSTPGHGGAGESKRGLSIIEHWAQEGPPAAIDMSGCTFPQAESPPPATEHVKGDGRKPVAPPCLKRAGREQTKPGAKVEINSHLVELYEFDFDGDLEHDRFRRKYDQKQTKTTKNKSSSRTGSL